MKQYTYTDSSNQQYQYKIESLRGKDVLQTRSLWEEVFAEDSQAFTEYYFSHKAEKNVTFVCTYEDTVVSMIHMTPYKMHVEGNIISTFYIVGVATKQEHRRRGLMAALLQEVFTYAKEVNSPFIFLMPADPAIYTPFGFSYIYSRPEYEIPSAMEVTEVYISSFQNSGYCMNYINSSFSSDTLCKLSAFADKILSTQYDYYIPHTPEYFHTLLLELKSQNGGIFVLTKGDDIVGYFLYAKEGKPFIQEMLLSPLLEDPVLFDFMSTTLPILQKEYKPIIMAKNVEIPTDNVTCDYVNQLANLKGCINEIV